jgi:hypothetical protein
VGDFTFFVGALVLVDGAGVVEGALVTALAPGSEDDDPLNGSDPVEGTVFVVWVGRIVPLVKVVEVALRVVNKFVVTHASVDLKYPDLLAVAIIIKPPINIAVTIRPSEADVRRDDMDTVTSDISSSSNSS